MTRGWLAAVAAVTALAACQARNQPRGAVVQSLGRIGPVPGPGIAAEQVANPLAGDANAIAQGYQLFHHMNCAGCHGDHGGGGMGPSLRDSLWYFGSADAQIFGSIYEGRDEGMPAWGTKLTTAQIWKLVSYIKSMRTPDEPDAPR